MKNPALQSLNALKFLWLGVALAAVAACGGNLREQRISDGEAIVNLGGDPKTLNPLLVVDVISSQAVTTLTRGLTVLDGEGHAQPELAERWEVSEDGLTWDFYLREAQWTNGDPVTADDFLYAWIEQMLNPEFGAEYAYMLFNIEGAKGYYEEGHGDRSLIAAEAVAPNHLRVRLTGPAPYFPQLVAHHSFYPVNASVARENPNWAQRAQTYVGNGPFRLVEFIPGDRLIAERNPDYWNAANVGLNRLIYRFIEEETTARLAFDTGEIDGTTSVPRADLAQLRDSPALRILPQIGTYYLNLNVPHEIFQDLRVRKALALAIDRASITENISRAGERPAFGLVPPSLYGEQGREPFFQDAQFDEARRLLAEAGYPGGEGFPTLRYLYNTLELHSAIAQVIQETWRRELGIEIELENQEFKVVIENRNQGNFDIARNGWVADFADPINFLELFLSYSGNNNSHWDDLKYDAMVEAARREADPEKRLAMLKEAEAYLMSQWPIVPIYYYSMPYLSAPRLEGYDMNPMHSFDAARLRWSENAGG